MKKLITLLLIFALVLSCGITAFAYGSDTLDNDKKQTGIGVYAKAEYDVEGVYPARVTDAKAVVTTDEGITVSVTDAPRNAVRLMVVPVPEAEKKAWEWITDSLKTTATPVHAFNIYFEDASGNRVDLDGAEVTVNCPHCADIPVVCSLDTDGTAQVLTSSALGTAVSFTANGSPYYVIGEKIPALNDTEPDDTHTGDNSSIWLWIALLFISGGSLLGTVIYKKKQKEN